MENRPQITFWTRTALALEASKLTNSRWQLLQHAKRKHHKVYMAMGNQPRLHLNPEVLDPAMPEQVRKEIVDLLAEALIADLPDSKG